MAFTHAIARKPGENFAQGITTSNLGSPSYELMLQQHESYVKTLQSLGLEVTVLNPEPNYPDAHFTEDVAIVTPDVAIITNPGAQARKGEEKSIGPVLAQYRKTVHIRSPGTMDGGDILMVGKHFFIGVSERTNQEGASQLGEILEEHGNTWTTIPVAEGLHFKSSVNYVGGNTLLVTQDFANLKELDGFEKIIVDRDEEYACNTLLVNDCLITPKGFPKVKRELEKLDLKIIELNMSEVQKMDGGLTCLSLRF